MRKVNARSKRKLEEEVACEDTKRTKLELNDEQKIQRTTLANIKKKRSSLEYLLKLHLNLRLGLVDSIPPKVFHFSKEHSNKNPIKLQRIGHLLLESIFIAKDPNSRIELIKLLSSTILKLDVPTAQKIILSLMKNRDGKIFTYEELDPHPINIVTYGLKRRLITATDPPKCVFHCAQRNMRSIASAHTRISSLNFYVLSFLRGCEQTKNCVLENTLLDMVTDRDPRVRCTAIDGLAELCKFENGVTLKTYEAMTKMISDSDRQVRIEAMKILLYFANKMPTLEISESFNHGTNILLTDDAFSIICHAINDQEVLVRVEAAKLLGMFDTVSDSFLDQTLDKKLMRTVKTNSGAVVQREASSMFSITKHASSIRRSSEQSRWKSWQQNREKKSAYLGEWASGKDLNAPSPVGEVKPSEEQESIIPQGACGAFVTALEDEFMSVRKAAVYSLGKLAAQRPSFATTALDHLADMFNDEIASVRLDAIRALTPLVVHGQLQKEQLEVILKCLDDAMWESRQALRDLLTKAEFADLDCLKLVVKALLNCLQRFPVDREKIFKCLSDIGLHHGIYVHRMVANLLDIHPIFEPQEQPIDDNFYSAKLILVLNAASKHEPLVSLLPYYVLKHYRFMRAARPDLVAAVSRIDDELLLCSRIITHEKGENNVEVLIKTYECLRDVQKETYMHDRSVLRRLISDDLVAISSFNALLSGGANFLVNICELLSSLESIQQTVVCVGNMSDIMALLEEEQTRVRCLPHQFSNLDISIKSLLIEINLHLDVLLIMVRLTKAPEDLSIILDDLLEVISVNEKRWNEAETIPTSNAVKLVASLHEMAASEQEQPIVGSSFLGQIMQKFSVALPDDFPNIDKIECKWAKIIDPEKEFAVENSLRFVSGLPIGLSFSVILYNITESDIMGLRIQVDYPDQSRSYHRPRMSDFSISSSNKTLLSTKVLLTTTTAWAESALATLTIVILSGDCGGNTPVPLCQSTSSQESCSMQVRLHPMQRT